jgi:hypothetical protein
MELFLVFAFVLLIEDAKRIILDRFFLFDNDFATIQALPTLKVKEMVEE